MLGIQEASNKWCCLDYTNNHQNLKSFRTVRKLGGTGSLSFLARASDPGVTDGSMKRAGEGKRKKLQFPEDREGRPEHA